MKELHVFNIDIFTESHWVINGSLLITNGKITAIFKEDELPRDENNTYDQMDGKGLRAIPGFIDTHIHGALGSDFMDGTSEALSTIASILPQEGTTRFVATTMTGEEKKIESALSKIASYEQQSGEAKIEGIHVEGPFIAKKRAGAQPTDLIIPPNAVLLSHWQEIAEGMIRTITLAPELDTDGSCIKRARELDINVSAGHTDATFEEMKHAVKLGVNQVTHLCNGMRGLHHREVGVIGAVSILDDLVGELIVDGIHVSDAMIEMLVKLIGIERLILITDGMRAKYMEPGTYDLGGQSVRVTDNYEARLTSGSLAGSIVQMNEAAYKMSRIKGVNFEDVIPMTSYNPATQLGIFDETGSISLDKEADIILVDDRFNVYLTICQGVVAHNDLVNYGTLSDE